MNFNFKKVLIPLGILPLLTGCVDNDYDLSDIDTTSELKVKDLVLPINLESIMLDNIISLDEDSKIKEVTIDGKTIYAVTETGDFSSDDIEIKGFTAPGPTISPSSAVFNLAPDVRAITETHSYQFSSFDPQDVNFEAKDVDKAIERADAIDIEPLNIHVTFVASGMSDATMSFKTLNLNFIKGMTFRNLPSNYNYDFTTGKLKITNIPFNGNKASIDLIATSIDFRPSNTVINADRTLDFKSQITIESGELVSEITIDPANPKDPDPEVKFTVNTTVDDIVATNFTGLITYDLEGEDLNIDPVDLSDLPDFLSQDGTDLRLANPQIYLNINNPLANRGYDLYFTTSLELTSVRSSGSTPYKLNPGQEVKVGYNRGNGPYNFVLSPSMPSNPLADYKNDLSHVGFSQLSDVLSGNGLPNKIEINIVDPMLPSQAVTKFKLNTTIPGVEGKYEFFAPLALKPVSDGQNGSVIIYSDTEDGWGDDDLDKMTIELIQVEADAYSTVPLNAHFTAHPIDRKGNKIDVEIKGADIQANAQGQHIVITAAGTIKNLDGITFEAVVTAGSEEALSPDQTIRLENLKAKVTGNYLTDF